MTRKISRKFARKFLVSQTCVVCGKFTVNCNRLGQPVCINAPFCK